MRNYFRGSEQFPYHLSVGAILIDRDNRVACHHFDDFRGYRDFYTLMRETLEPQESLEQAVTRGMREEFGLKGRLLAYVGSIESQFLREAVIVQKTTLYFLCSLVETGATVRRQHDEEEKRSEVQWLTLGELIVKMKEQALRLTPKTMESDLDESSVLERARDLLASAYLSQE